MSWSPTQKMLQQYLGIMTNAEFARMEDAIFEGRKIVFSDDEKISLDHRLLTKKKHEEKLVNTARLNNEAIAMEESGDLEGAIKLYELNISTGYPATQSYDRLMAIYKKKRMPLDELRVIDLAIKIFSTENQYRFKEAISNLKNSAYTSEIKEGFDRCEKVKNKEGWNIFNPYPVNKYILRKEKLLSKQKIAE